MKPAHAARAGRDRGGELLKAARAGVANVPPAVAGCALAYVGPARRRRAAARANHTMACRSRPGRAAHAAVAGRAGCDLAYV